jgi:hypothetical protein
MMFLPEMKLSGENEPGQLPFQPLENQRDEFIRRFRGTSQ